MTARTSMGFRRIAYGPYTITVMEGDEPGYSDQGTLLVSVAGPGLPNIRLTEHGPEQIKDDDVYGANGVIVFGNFKGDRPALGSVDASPLEPGELRHWRTERGMSQRAVGEALGVAPNTIARWERGEVPMPPFLRLALASLWRCAP